MSRPPAGVKLAAAVALAYGLGAGLLTVLMVANWLQGRPITTPVQLLEPDLPILVPGESLALAPGGPSLEVTPALVRIVAAGNIGVFAGACLLWLVTAAGLWQARRRARPLGLILFSALAVVGLFNLLVELVLVIMAGNLEALGGAAVVLATFAATLAGLILIPLLPVVLLARPAAAAAFAGGGPGRPALVLSLVLHFALVALLLLPAALAPATLAPPWVLLGPWPLAGVPARLVLLVAAALHALCGWGWWQGRPWVPTVSFWLNLFLVTAAAGSAALADAPALAALGGGILTPPLARAALVAVAILGGSLLPVVRRAARHLPHAEG